MTGHPPTPWGEAVLQVVAQIPAGRVLTYGDVAELLECRAGRAVGAVMARHGDRVPWWRVVRAGGLPPGRLAAEALDRLEDEGTPMATGNDGVVDRVDLGRARWDAAGLVTPDSPRRLLRS